MKKLTAEEIGQAVIKNNHIKFDRCIKCEGLQNEGTMSRNTDDIEDRDRICDECSSEEYKASPAKEWNVAILRTSYSHTMMAVLARTEEEAIEKAIDEAGDVSFSENSSDYTAPDGALEIK